MCVSERERGGRVSVKGRKKREREIGREGERERDREGQGSERTWGKLNG